MRWKIIIGLVLGIILGGILAVLTAGVLMSTKVTVVNRWITIYGFGTVADLTLYPPLIYNAFKKAILVQGGGDGPIPVNTLYRG